MTKIQLNKKRGSAFITVFMLLLLLSVSMAAYVNNSTQALRLSRRQYLNVLTAHLCDSGSQVLQYNLWAPFKANQNFNSMDATLLGASVGSPLASIQGTIPGVGSYASGVIKYEQVDSYNRRVTIRTVGWIDSNNNGVINQYEPQKIVDVVATYQLQRSQVFDYTYFINNYGWMDGFSSNQLIVNGDMRANGDFTFTNGLPTVNGTVAATHNEKLIPAPTGVVNVTPVKQTDSTYSSISANNGRMRQGYNAATMGAKGSAAYESWRDYIFESSASIVNGRSDGAITADSTGLKAWSKTTQSDPGSTTILDTSPTQEVVMPDLNNLTYYQNLSTNFVDNRQYYTDGSTNPNYGTGAYVDVWNSNTNAYQRVSTNGVVSGSAALIGTSSHPVKIHGPVTFTQDAPVSGYFTGQGTIYTGRNVHVVGSIKYVNGPDFRGSSQTSVDNANEKRDMVALAARGSVIMGDTSTFTYSYPLKYMMPPFTKPRYDNTGNLIPAFDATQTDGTGFKLYQSVMGDAYIHSISSSIDQIDAVIYSNFTGGGDLATSGNGLAFNGSIITRDEAMCIFSLPMRMNYDSRIREKSITKTPLIDLQLPRSPALLTSSWQDRGFTYR